MVETTSQKTAAREIAIRTEPASGIGTRLDEAAKKLKEEESYSLVLGDNDLEGLIQDVMLPILKDQENRGIRVDVKHVSVSIEERKIGLIAGVKKKLGPIWPPELGMNAELELENSQQDTHEGIQTTKLQVNPPTFMGFNIFEEVNSFLGGDKINSTFRGYLTKEMQERGVNVGDIGLHLTEDNHLKIELNIPKAEAAAPEQAETAPSQPLPVEPQLAEEPEVAAEPAANDVTPKEAVQEKRAEPKKPSFKKPRGAEASQVPPKAKRESGKERPETPKGSLKDTVTREKEAFDEIFGDYLGRKLTGEQFEQIVDVYAESIFGINDLMNKQIDPNTAKWRVGERYWVSNDRLVALEKDVAEKTTSLGDKVVLLQDYTNGLYKRIENFESLKARLGQKVKPEEEGRPEVVGPTPIQLFIEKVRERRKNVEEALLARKVLEESKPHRGTVSGPSLERRRERYEHFLDTALKDQQDALLAANHYLNIILGAKTSSDEGILFGRFKHLGGQLDKLYKKRLKTTSLLEERTRLLKECDRILDERLEVFLELARGRGLEPVPEVTEEIVLVSPEEKRVGAELRKPKAFLTSKAEEFQPQKRKEFLPLVGTRGQRVQSVKISFEDGGRRDEESYLQQGTPDVPMGARPSDTLKIWEKLRGMEVPVVPRIWRTDDDKRLLIPDLSKGGRYELTDLEFLILHWENFGRKTKFLPDWLKSNKEIIADKLVGSQERAGKSWVRLELGAYIFVYDPQKRQVDVAASYLDQAALRQPGLLAEREELIDKNLSSVKEFFVGLGLFTEDEWKKRYPTSATQVKKAA